MDLEVFSLRLRVEVAPIVPKARRLSRKEGSGTHAASADAAKPATISMDWLGERLANGIVGPINNGGDLVPSVIMSLNIEPVSALDNIVDARPVCVGGEEPITEREYRKVGVKLTVISASSIDVFSIENIDDNDTVAVDVPEGGAEAIAVTDAPKSKVIALLGEMVAVNVSGVVGPAPEVALKVYEGDRPVTVSVRDPEAKPDVTMEYVACFLALTVTELVEDVLVNVIRAFAVLVALAVTDADFTCRGFIIQSPMVNATVKLITRVWERLVPLLDVEEPARVKGSRVLRILLVMCSPFSKGVNEGVL